MLVARCQYHCVIFLLKERLMGQSYRELIVWQRAMDLATTLYQVSASFTREETYSLTSQVRRAAVSVPSNIAEGQGRATRGEFYQFLGHARGSLYEYEVETNVQLAVCLTLIS